jgi:hypothetical protein
MLFTALSVSLFTSFSILIPRRTGLRFWKGKTERHFERDWEILTDKKYFYFSVGSFKTTYFKISRPGFAQKIWQKLFAKWTAKHTLAADLNFQVESDDPRVSFVLSNDPLLLQIFMDLKDNGDFCIFSTGNELHGRIKLSGDANEASAKWISALQKFVEAQFDFPLNETKPLQLFWWRWMDSLPIIGFSSLAVSGAAWFALGPSVSEWGDALKLSLAVGFLGTGLLLLLASLLVPSTGFVKTGLRLVFANSFVLVLWIFLAVTETNFHLHSPTSYLRKTASITNEPVDQYWLKQKFQ